MVEPIQLGFGSWAQVRLGRDTETNEPVAVKIIEKNTLLPKDRALMDKERMVLMSLKHKNIIRLIDSCEDEQNIYFVLEYREGRDMFQFLQNYGRQSERQARRYFQQLLDGVEYLHQQNIAHRDLKVCFPLMNHSFFFFF